MINRCAHNKSKKYAKLMMKIRLPSPNFGFGGIFAVVVTLLVSNTRKSVRCTLPYSVWSFTPSFPSTAKIYFHKIIWKNRPLNLIGLQWIFFFFAWPENRNKLLQIKNIRFDIKWKENKKCNTQNPTNETNENCGILFLFSSSSSCTIQSRLEKCQNCVTLELRDAIVQWWWATHTHA